MYLLSFFILILPSVLSQSNDLVTIYKIFGNEEFQALCVSPRMNEAVTWITNSSNTANNYSSAMKLQIKGNQWITEKSFSNTFGYILDSRWESFPTHVTQILYDSKKDLQFEKLSNVGSFYELTLSVRLDKEAHIYLCDYENTPPPINYCYWIILGGFSGTKSVLRKCKAHEISSINSSPSSKTRCGINLNETLSNPLDKDKWKHLKIQKSSNKLEIFFSDSDVPYLGYTETKLQTIRSIYVNSRSTIQGYWKLHDYFYSIVENVKEREMAISDVYLRSNACFYFYLSLCPTCSISFFLTNSRYTVNNYQTFNYDENNSWQPITIKFTINQESLYTLVANLKTFNSRPFWAISDLRYIDNCNDTNAVKTSEITLKKGELYSTRCQYLKDSSLTSTFSQTQSASPDCASNTFSSKCFTCQSIQMQFCQGLICENDQNCYCASGYTGKFCEKTCGVNYYGKNCSETCGQCENPCNNVDGTCKTCLNNFYGDLCNSVKYPILTNAPIVEEPCVNCEIKFQSEYIGSYEPKYFKIIYKQVSDNSYSYLPIEYFQSGEISRKLENLKISSEYVAKVVLLVDENVFYDENIKNVTFKTSCNELTENNILIKASSNSVEIVIERLESICFLNNYIFANSNQNFRLQKLNIIRDLLPKTTYAFNILNLNTSYNLTTSFTTDESAPGIVQTTHVSTSDTIEIKWNKLSDQNGTIINYTIKWKLAQFRACTYKETSTDFEFINVTESEVTLNELTPYASYSIIIYANNKYKGVEQQFFALTEPGDDIETLRENFFLNVTPKSQRAFISMKINCEKIVGAIFILINGSCANPWCTGSTTNVLTFPNFVSYENLIPFSNYTFHCTISYKDTFETGISIIENFNTSPDVPNDVQNLDVYSKNSTHLFVRWSKPYPPNGVLEDYQICYDCYQSYYSICNYKIFLKENSFCDIWNDMICVEISFYNKKQCTIVVTAKNVEIRNRSNNVQLHVYTSLDVPEPPNKIGVQFGNESDNVTIMWQHPNKTNGVLNKFIIEMEKASFTHLVKKEKLKYKHKIKAAIDGVSLKVCVMSVNSRSVSKPECVSIKTPPKVPVFQEEPFIETTTNYTIKVKLSPANFSVTSQTYLFIIIYEVNNTDVQNGSAIKEKCPGYKENSFKNWIAKELILKENTQQERNEIIGDGSGITSSEYLKTNITNVELEPGTYYIIDIVLISSNEMYTRCKVYPLNANTGTMKLTRKSESSPVLYYIIPIILVSIIVFIVVIAKKKKISIPFLKTTFSHRRNQTNDNIHLTSSNGTVQCNNEETSVTSKFENLQDPRYTKRIKISDLEAYVKESIFNGELERQHELFPRGEQMSCSYGKLPQNKSKNRYGNLAAYDHSRVVLEKIPNIDYSDYINANYIQGYQNTPKAYIATQGPKPNTLTDFWRMIWAENVLNIVMLANVYENGKKKTERYWPNYGEETDFDGVKVSFVSFEIYADFETRIFNVCYQNIERKIEQLHFTAWPDHGVPLYSQSLVPILRKILKIPHGKSPIVVHCSAGVGRTGTIILIDLCLRMAAHTGSVDVLKSLQEIRSQRPNMVDNIEQYKLVHLVILESLLAPDTSIVCNEQFNQTMERVLSNEIPRQMDYITNSVWQENAIANTNLQKHARHVEEKDRFVDTAPEGYGIFYLTPITGDDSSVYINAVQVDGFKQPKRFIATQQPMPNTLRDFWRMIYQNDVNTIVNLQEIDCEDETCCQFWPTVCLKPEKGMTLTQDTFNNLETYTLTNVNMSYKNEQRKISVISIDNWSHGNEVPPTVGALIAVFYNMNQLARNEKKVVITCRDGTTACGLYISMCFVLEKIKLEQLCDVCQAVRVIRRSRKQFVQSKEQFMLLYKLANLYLAEFEFYSNFSGSAAKN